MQEEDEKEVVVELDDIDISQFDEAGGLSEDDFVVLSTASKTSAKISVSLFRSIVAGKITPSIKNGVWWIGDVNTEVVAAGQTPMFRKADLGIEWKYESEPNTAWRLLVPLSEIAFKFSDLTEEQRESISLKYSDLTEEEIAELQKPANDMIAVLQQTNTSIASAESARVVAEKSRVDAEVERAKAESTRASNENARHLNETSRQQAETEREQNYATIQQGVNDAIDEAHNAAVEAKNLPKIINGTWWVYDANKRTYVDTGQSASSDYQLTKEKIENVFTGDIESHFHSKYVEKVTGKGLSTEDFTTLLKERLEGLENYDDTEIVNAVNKLREDLDAITGTEDASSAIETFNEVIAFLDGISDTEELSGIVASIEQQIAAKQDKNIYFTNIEAREWVEDSTYTEFAYRCDLACEGVTPNDYAEVVFEVAQAASGEYAPICESRENAVRIWGASDRIIVVPTIIVSK